MPAPPMKNDPHPSRRLARPGPASSSDGLIPAPLGRASPDPDAADPDRLEAVEDIIDYEFDDRELLAIALTHASLRSSGAIANERMEFLGDAILGLVVSEELFRRFPNRDEGELTRSKSVVVSTGSLAKATRRLGVDDLVAVSKGVRGKRGALPSSLLAGAFESIVGAIYLDGGLEPAARFILEVALGDDIERATADRVGENYKALLQHLTQRASGTTPTYRVVSVIGPEHGKLFRVVAVVEGEELGAGEGNTKKEAEQAAARVTLTELEARLARGDATAPGRRRRRSRSPVSDADADADAHDRDAARADDDDDGFAAGLDLEREPRRERRQR